MTSEATEGDFFEVSDYELCRYILEDWKEAVVDMFSNGLKNVLHSLCEYNLTFIPSPT